MANHTFTNPIREAEVSLAVERLLVGLYPSSTWAPTQGRIDFTAPPAGFYDMGAVVEDTPTVKTTRSKFMLDLGIPAVRQYEAINKVEGTFTCQLHSNSWRKLQFMLGNSTAFGAGLTTSSSQTNLGTIASVTNQYTVTVVQSNGGTSTFTYGQNVVFAASINLMDNPDANETRVQSISVNNNSLVSLVLYPIPISSPVVNNNVYTYAYVKQVMGTKQNDHFVLLGVADFIDGVQLIHYMPNVVPAADAIEEPRPSQNERLQMAWNMFGYSQALNGTPQVIVMERYQFQPGF